MKTASPSQGAPSSSTPAVNWGTSWQPTYTFAQTRVGYWMPKGETQEQEDGLSQMRQAQDAGIYCCPTLGGVLIIFPYLSYSYLTVST